MLDVADMPKKRTHGGSRPGSGRPVTTGRTSRGAAAVLVRLAADELAEIERVAGGRARVAAYLRAAGVREARNATNRAARREED